MPYGNRHTIIRFFCSAPPTLGMATRPGPLPRVRCPILDASLGRCQQAIPFQTKGGGELPPAVPDPSGHTESAFLVRGLPTPAIQMSKIRSRLRPRTKVRRHRNHKGPRCHRPSSPGDTQRIAPPRWFNIGINVLFRTGIYLLVHLSYALLTIDSIGETTTLYVATLFDGMA